MSGGVLAVGSSKHLSPIPRTGLLAWPAASFVEAHLRKMAVLSAYTLIAIVLLLHFFVSSICKRLVEQGSGLVAQLGDS